MNKLSKVKLSSSFFPSSVFLIRIMQFSSEKTTDFQTVSNIEFDYSQKAQIGSQLILFPLVS